MLSPATEPGTFPMFGLQQVCINCVLRMPCRQGRDFLYLTLPHPINATGPSVVAASTAKRIETEPAAGTSKHPVPPLPMPLAAAPPHIGKGKAPMKAE